MTSVTQKSMFTIPAPVGRQVESRPGGKPDGEPVAGSHVIWVRVIPDRAEPARRLLGSARRFSPERDAVAELVREREAQG